jgi:hypothetical protein
MSKTYIGSTPFSPSTCRVDARGYDDNEQEKILELQCGLFSSPDGDPDPNAIKKIDITSQNARRLPRMRNERYMQIGVTSNLEIDCIIIGTSMGGLVV